MTHVAGRGNVCYMLGRKGAWSICRAWPNAEDISVHGEGEKSSRPGDASREKRETGSRPGPALHLAARLATVGLCRDSIVGLILGHLGPNLKPKKWALSPISNKT